MLIELIGCLHSACNPLAIRCLCLIHACPPCPQALDTAASSSIAGTAECTHGSVHPPRPNPLGQPASHCPRVRTDGSCCGRPGTARKKRLGRVRNVKNRAGRAPPSEKKQNPTHTLSPPHTHYHHHTHTITTTLCSRTTPSPFVYPTCTLHTYGWQPGIPASQIGFRQFRRISFL